MNQKGLKRTLGSNAVFSSLSGILLVSAADWFSKIFTNAPTLLFIGLGAVLLVFAVDLLWNVQKPEISKAKALYFVSGDYLWVALSGLLLAGGWVSETLAQALVVGTAVVVLAFAVFQTLYIIGNEISPSLETSH